MNIDSGMPTQFIDVTYDGDPELKPVLLLEAHRLWRGKEWKISRHLKTSQKRRHRPFHDAVGRLVPQEQSWALLVPFSTSTSPEFHDRLEKQVLEVEIPIGGARLSFPGQVLGCNYSGDDDSIGHYLFLGSGDFHPIGLVLHTGKPLAMLDPYTGDAEEMSLQRIERILRQRFGLIMASGEAQKFGILIGEKPGQMRRTLALRMKRMLEKHGKKGYLLALEHVGPELIDFYPVELS